MYSHEQDLWLDLVLARIDDDFLTRQQHLAQLMRDKNISFEAYLSVLVAFHEVIENIFIRAELGNVELLRAFQKIAGVNTCIVIDFYNEALNEQMRTQHTTLLEMMSTPVSQLWDGILFMPLVGIVDSKRAQLVMMAMLQKIALTQAKTFVLDISGIAVLDTAVANHLIKMTKAARLMGCLCIISGISPAVAQTLVELGVATNEISTTGNLQAALLLAFETTGKKIVDKELHKSLVAQDDEY
jgi:rsbT co-antagonist protein RsbR